MARGCLAVRDGEPPRPRSLPERGVRLCDTASITDGDGCRGIAGHDGPHHGDAMVVCRVDGAATKVASNNDEVIALNEAEPPTALMAADTVLRRSDSLSRRRAALRRRVVPAAEAATAASGGTRSGMSRHRAHAVQGVVDACRGAAVRETRAQRGRAPPRWLVALGRCGVEARDLDPVGENAPAANQKAAFDQSPSTGMPRADKR